MGVCAPELTGSRQQRLPPLWLMKRNLVSRLDKVDPPPRKQGNTDFQGGTRGGNQAPRTPSPPSPRAPVLSPLTTPRPRSAPPPANAPPPPPCPGPNQDTPRRPSGVSIHQQVPVTHEGSSVRCPDGPAGAGPGPACRQAGFPGRCKAAAPSEPFAPDGHPRSVSTGLPMGVPTGLPTGTAASGSGLRAHRCGCRRGWGAAVLTDRNLGRQKLPRRPGLHPPVFSVAHSSLQLEGAPGRGWVDRAGPGAVGTSGRLHDSGHLPRLGLISGRSPVGTPGFQLGQRGGVGRMGLSSEWPQTRLKPGP